LLTPLGELAVLRRSHVLLDMLMDVVVDGLDRRVGKLVLSVRERSYHRQFV
jgi:hypothetical protein